MNINDCGNQTKVVSLETVEDAIDAILHNLKVILQLAEQSALPTTTSAERVYLNQHCQALKDMIDEISKLIPYDDPNLNLVMHSFKTQGPSPLN